VAVIPVPSPPELRRTTDRDRLTLTMSHLCCHHCRVRFTAEAATYLLACPECARPTDRMNHSEDLLGFRLFDPLDISDLVTRGPEAPPPEPGPRRNRC
jgi:hypothetical protein